MEPICIVFSEWRHMATEPMTFADMLARPTEPNTRTALFEAAPWETESPAKAVKIPAGGQTTLARAWAFKRAVEQGELTTTIWEQTGAKEI